MDSTANDALMSLYRRWKWDADWMTCRWCGRHLIASRDGEPFKHEGACRNSDDLHPWSMLRNILNGRQPNESTEKQS